MNSRRGWEQYAGVAGILFVLLNVAAAFLPGAPPKPDASLAQFRAYYTDHRGAVLLGCYLGGLASIFSLWFIVVLRDVLRRAEGGDAPLSAIVLAAGVLTNAMALNGALV